MGHAQLVSFSSPDAAGEGPTAASLVGTPIIVDADDFAGIKIAAKSLAHDIGLVSRTEDSPVVELEKDTTSATVALAGVLIVLGSIQTSRLIQDLEKQGLVDLSQIRGKDECFTTALLKGWIYPGVSDGRHTIFVIAGSDKRGAIYGAYALSEQIGVSPWHWWSDVPAQHHSEIFALPVTTTSREPSVKFRGLFINDEAPSLSANVHEKFGGFNSDFYRHVFDLLLRLKANFLWPAMWPNYPPKSFFTDDPDNQKLAHDYGIMMSTSHHEPMQRLSNEWFAVNSSGSWDWDTNKEKITEFFDEGVRRAKGYDSYFTLGMRGEYDNDMETDDPTKVVNDVISTQRRLIKQHHGMEDAVPQLMALYKEVQEYWDAGQLKVPDDVTLLFADDNFGSLRRLPTEQEKDRKGGSGIYYHLQYVGVPRSYKWINPNSLAKTWHQLQEAYRRHARQIWVFNVGDIKPQEVPFTMCMQLAYDIDSIPASGLSTFLGGLAQQTFGSTLANEVAAIWDEYHRLVAIRRHEHIEAEHFSLYYYNEANTILARWETLLHRAEALYSTADIDVKPALYQLILHPVKASTIYISLRIHQARNKIWAVERRNTANKAFHKVLELFNADFALSREYHALLNGKWNHIMDQTHYGLAETWRTPNRDMVSGLCYVQTQQDSVPMVGQLGVAIEGHPGVRPGFIGEGGDRNRPSQGDLLPGVTLGRLTPWGPDERWFELYSRGTKTLDWHCRGTELWVVLSQTTGTIGPDTDDVRLFVSIDWSQVPKDYVGEAKIVITSTGGNYGIYQDDYEELIVPIANYQVTSKTHGYIETAGLVSMPATKPLGAIEGYTIQPEGGRNGQGLIFPKPTTSTSSDIDGYFLQYSFFVFETTKAPVFHLYFNTTLDVDPVTPMQYEISLDGFEAERHRLVESPDVPGELPPGWSDAVQDCAWHREHELGELRAGHHELFVRLMHTNMLFEWIVVDLGGLRPSYLQPPASRVNVGL